MKYKILAIKKLGPYEYQYSLNQPLTNLSCILTFSKDILQSNYKNSFEYAISCIQNKEVLINGFIYPLKESMTISQWAPIFALEQILDYYKNYRDLPSILISADTETRSKYSNKELSQILFQ